jgi:competence protein ComEA
MSDIIVPRTWRDRVESVAGRRRESALLAVVVLAVVAGGVALWSRGAPATIAPPAAPTSRGASGGTAPSGEVAAEAGTGPAGGALLVHVAGAVQRPGLYEMPADARVADAVQAAGGPRPRADLDALNLAEPLVDGARIEVVGRGEAVAAPVASPAVGAEPTTLVHLNSADQAALESIPEVGPVTALAILEYRAEIGSFSSIDQLLEVSGVGPATLEAIRPYVTL